MTARVIGAMSVALTLAVCVHAAPTKTKHFVPKPQPLKSDLELGFSNITRDQFFANYKRLGVLPVELPEGLRDRDDARQDVEEALIKYLRLANIDAVPSTAYLAIADRLSREGGGTYDPHTGKLKADVAKAISERARREFVEAQHLDGFLLPRVREVSGSLSGPNLWWDGVSDFSAGREHKRGDDWWPVGLTGDLPALSLQVQVFKTPDHVNFARYGGIQPMNYARNVAGEIATFMAPPTAELLKDRQRIDRAARVVTFPLTHTPRDMAQYFYKPEYAEWMDAATLPALPEPADLMPPSPLLVPRERILHSVHRIALTPVFDAGVAIPEATRAQLLATIRREIAPLQWDIVDAPQAHELLARQMMTVNLFDPFTGKRDDAAVSAARRSVFESLGIKPAPDAILWVSVVPTLAMQRLGDAVWDGANQNALTMGPVKKIGKLAAHFRFTLYSAPGWSTISAASLQVNLRDATDTTMYLSRGGIQLLNKIVSDTVRGDPVEIEPLERFLDRQRVEQSAHLALRDLVLTPEALGAELDVSERSLATGKPAK